MIFQKLICFTMDNNIIDAYAITQLSRIDGEIYIESFSKFV